MNWNCTQIEERISDSLEGRLSQEEARWFSNHVSSCANCRELVESVRGLVREMHHLEMLPEPPDLVRKIVDATFGSREKVSFWRGSAGWAAPLWRPRLAMGAVTMAAVAVIVIQISGLKLGHLRHANLNPVAMINNADRQAHMVYARSLRFVSDLRVVYEIESRLGPQPESEPQPLPQTLPEQPPRQPPEKDPQQKSENKKNRDRGQIRSVALLAVLFPDRAIAGDFKGS
jgi:anti-sigma factor RsiW